MVVYTWVIINLKNLNLILSKSLQLSDINDAKRNIVHSFAFLAAESSLDTFFLILLVLLGNLSESVKIKNLSKISCLLLTSNFILFITLFPAILSLILQFKKKSENIQHLREQLENDIKTTKLNTNDNSDSNKVKFYSTTSNPVLVYVKMVMVTFLIIIHLKLTFYNQRTSSQIEGELNFNFKLLIQFKFN
jgi:uncharacterized protein with PQ loop repeat